MTVYLPAILCLAALSAAYGAEIGQRAQQPIEAELLSRITARSVRAGDPIYASVAVDWRRDGCSLRRGAMLEGTVRAVLPHSFKARLSEIALSFDSAECGDAGMQAFGLQLEGVGAPVDDAVGDLMSSLPAGPEDGTGRLLPASHKVVLTAKDGRGRSSWHPGEVLGIKGVHLSVGTGPDGSSVLFRSTLDVELEIHTRLLLMPETGGTVAEGSRPTVDLPAAYIPAEDAAVLNPASLVAEAPPVTLHPGTDVGDNEGDGEGDLNRCIPSECAASPSTAASEESEADGTNERHYVGTIPLRALGFVPRINSELLALGEDDALAWLSPTELLVTFNPHELVPRHGIVTEGSTIRVIRAVLVDVSSHATKRTLEWHLPDKREYLWVLPGNRVLVHVENELRVYGSGLRIEKRITLGGALSFVRVSPDAKMIALGVVKERHTPELHGRLKAALDKDPEEDVRVLLMDGHFETIGSSMSTSDRLPPELLNEGQVRLIAPLGQNSRRAKHYGLQLRTWENTTQDLARFMSTCTPEVSTLAPDLVFLVTCDNLNGARHYTVFRPDGKVVLRGQSLLREFGHAARGGGEANAFAVRIFAGDGPMLPGEPFHAADLHSAELRVYRPQDGKRLFSVRVKDPAASSGGYALSPSGEVAILAQDGVDVYATPR